MLVDVMFWSPFHLYFICKGKQKFSKENQNCIYLQVGSGGGKCEWLQQKNKTVGR